MRNVLVHLLFIALVLGLGLLSGFTNAPGAWYQSLEKPVFNPPSWLFGPVWTALYVLIGIAGARVWRQAPASLAMQIWFTQLVLNLLWSPAFFGMQKPLLGLVVILSLLSAVLAFIWTARPIDKVASLLFIPYAAWVAFATMLNGAIFLLN